jgi:agmatinase
MLKVLAAIAALATVLQAHEHDHDQEPIEGPLQKLWYNVLPGDGGTQVSPNRSTPMEPI